MFMLIKWFAYADEAHCISSWGREFRDDVSIYLKLFSRWPLCSSPSRNQYAKLGLLRATYPEVPIMALTATANQEVVEHVIAGLSIPDCVCLKQSLNRPNLYYSVHEKTVKVNEDIATFIKLKYENDSGIIYCHSRDDCEKVAKELREKHGLSAEHYHAKIPAKNKHEIHYAWQSGRLNIIVSTVGCLFLDITCMFDFLCR